MTVNSKPNNDQKKRYGRATTLWALGVILLVLAVAFSIGWATRGLKINNFTGIGQAEILEISSYDRGGLERVDIVYSFKVRITAGEETFTDRYKLSSKSDWHQGDILPITYNINNPREYVIDIAPEEYVQWYNKMGVLTLGLILGAVYCLGTSFRIKRGIAKEAELC